MLKALNVLEVENIVEYLKDILLWAQLQDVWSYEQGLILQFWKNETYYLILEMRSDRPLALLFEKKSPVLKGKKKKPVELFLKAHGVNFHLCDVKMMTEFGRVFQITLSPLTDRSVSCALEVVLVPHGSENILVYSDGKKSFWNRPVPLQKANPDFDLSQLEVRSLKTIQSLWLESFQVRSSKSKDKRLQEPVSLEKVIAKKQQALENLDRELVNLSQPYELFAEHLKAHLGRVGQKNILQAALAEFGLEKKLPSLTRAEEAKGDLLLRWMTFAFEKARHQKKKLMAHQERKQKIADDIETLSRLSPGEYVRRQVQNPFIIENTKLRKLDLDAGGIAYFGKSAADNLKLLRAAQAWDFWLHLKDYPSTHVIIHRNKNQKISQSDLLLVFKRLVEESRTKKSLLVGDTFSIVLTECRYVRPLKGASKGMVTYSNEQTFKYSYR